MSWLDQIGSVLQQYAGENPNPSDPKGHFDQIAQAAPQSTLSEGVSQAFRSEQTPPFQEMLSQLFGGAAPHQKAGILNLLISAVGPLLVSQVLGGKGLSGLGSLLSGGQKQVSPEQAAQVPPDVVGEIASHSVQQNPTIIDQVSQYVSGHPELLKQLGNSGISSILTGIAQRFL
jgi:hypothetical protein